MELALDRFCYSTEKYERLCKKLALRFTAFAGLVQLLIFLAVGVYNASNALTGIACTAATYVLFRLFQRRIVPRLRHRAHLQQLYLVGRSAEPRTLRFTVQEEGLRLDQPGVATVFAWSTITEVELADQTLYFRAGENLFAIPRSSVQVGSIEELFTGITARRPLALGSESATRGIKG